MMNANATSYSLSNPDEIYDSCYDGYLPAAVSATLSQHPAYIYSRLAGLDGALHTYVLWRGNHVKSVFMFVIRGKKMRVLNPLIGIESDDLDRFIVYAFSSFRHVEVIRFNSVEATVRCGADEYPRQRHNASESYIIDLPASSSEYENMLGKSTKKTVKYYRGKLERNCAGTEFHCHVGDEVPEQLVRAILRLNEARFQSKKVYYRESEENIARVVSLARQCGLVCAVTVGGRVCAGSINFGAGPWVVGHLLSHDASYAEFRLGTLTAYMTIIGAIERGYRYFDMGSSRFDYKDSFRGNRHDLDRLDIYRSRMHVALNVPHLAGSLTAAGFRRIKLRLDASEAKLAKRAFAGFEYTLRRVKNAL